GGCSTSSGASRSARLMHFAPALPVATGTPLHSATAWRFASASGCSRVPPATWSSGGGGREAPTGAAGSSAMALDQAASRFASTTGRLAAHVRTPVYREGYALVLSAGLAAALGFLYWIIAARTYKADVVGLNSAAISTMMLASGVAQLNLVGGLLRFVPGAGRSTWRLVGWSYAISLLVAMPLA